MAHDPQRGLLYGDIAINPTPDPYCPFVWLGLARYQPDSLPGLELSDVVLADHVQVPRLRMVTVAPDPGPDTFFVDVQGFSPLKLHFLFVVHMRVSVEQRIRGVDDADLGWSPVPDDTHGITIEKTVANRLPTLWRGHVTCPPDAARANSALLCVRSSRCGPTPSVGAPDADGRLVFAGTIVLSPLIWHRPGVGWRSRRKGRQVYE